MKKLIVFSILIFAFFVQANFAQENKVANFSTGKAGSSKYEHLSFWTNAGKRGEITYTYKNRDKDINLTYLEAVMVKGQKGFKIQFPNKLVLTIIPTGKRLKVIDEKSGSVKYFNWEYEGPVNGIGTFCTPCVESKDAVKFVKRYF